MYEEGEVFTLDDRAELDALAGKYAGSSITAMRGATRALLDGLAKGENGRGARTLIVRDWLAENPMPSESELDALLRLRDKAFRAKSASMDEGRYLAIDMSSREGIVDGAKAADMIALERKRARDEAHRLANGMVIEFAKRARIVDEYPEAVISQDDKDGISKSFVEYDQWEKTKAAFRERYEACTTVKERSELRSMFPELAKAAL